MKIIQFQGDLYEVEDWVTHIARDRDMEVYAFDRKPSYGGFAWSVEWEGFCAKVKPIRKDILRAVACEEV